MNPDSEKNELITTADHQESGLTALSNILDLATTKTRALAQKLELTEQEAKQIVEVVEARPENPQVLSYILQRLSRGISLSDALVMRAVIDAGEGLQGISGDAFLRLSRTFDDIYLDPEDPEDVQMTLEVIYSVYEDSGYSGPIGSFLERIMTIAEQNDIRIFQNAVDIYVDTKSYKAATRTQREAERDDGFEDDSDYRDQR